VRANLIGLMLFVAMCMISPLCGAYEVRTLPIGGTTAVVVSVGVSEKLELFLSASDGKFLGNFDRLLEYLEAENRSLLFAINAGMYHSGGRPVGLYIGHHNERYPLNEKSGEGNFFMKPNGVFIRDEKGFAILSTEQFIARTFSADIATQSGPLLLQNSEIPPLFKPNSTNNKYIRSVVGVKTPGEVNFVITNGPVNFYTLAAFFKVSLGCRDALYLDGYVSSLYLPKIGRKDSRRYENGKSVNLGPIIGLTVCREGDGTQQ